jgi:hypothetical protein
MSKIVDVDVGHQESSELRDGLELRLLVHHFRSHVRLCVFDFSIAYDSLVQTDADAF